MEEHKVNYFQGLVHTGEAHGFKTCAHSEIYTDRIAPASSSKELHRIVNTLSNRHTPMILPTIYNSADLPSLFIKQFTNKVEKHRVDIASEHFTSTLVTGTTTATFSSFEKVSQLIVNECILIFASSSVWNSIPNDVRCAPLLSSFMSRLKTYLFRSVYKD